MSTSNFNPFEAAASVIDSAPPAAMTVPADMIRSARPILHAVPRSSAVMHRTNPIIRLWRLVELSVIFGAKERIDWYENMDALRRSQVTTKTALEVIATENQTLKRPAASVYAQILGVIRNGGKMADAAAGLVPKSELLLISAGDATATPEGYSAAAKMLRNLQAMRATLIVNLAYPVLLLCIAAGVTYTFAQRIVPVVKMSTSYATATGLIRYFVEFCEFFVDYAWLFATGVIGVLLATLISAPRYTGRFRRALDRWYPPFSIYRHFTAAVFLSGMGALVKAGLHVDAALKACYGQASTYLQSHIEPILLTYKQGENETAAFKTGLLDSNVIIRITALSRAGSLRDALCQISDDVVAIAKARIAALTVVIFALIFLAVGAFVLAAASFLYEYGAAATATTAA